MARPDKYHGTTVTEFVTKYASLLAALALCLLLTLVAADRPAAWLGRAVALSSFCAAYLVWLALLFHCARARPLTALMELFALTLLCGLAAVLLAWLAHWWAWRFVTLPALLYLTLFLILDETGLRRRPTLNNRAAQLALRLACLLAALLVAYLLKP
ncbi:MAG TPA: hypothetical protein VF546_21595 [Pyrinomonadaceae bacterium]|jgi:hypothetical protein